MASISKEQNGKWRASVYKNGVRKTKVLLTKREAEAWAAKTTTEIVENIATPPNVKFTVADGLIKYRDTVSVTKKGQYWEEMRINAFLKYGHPLFAMRIGDVIPEHVNSWRDARLLKVRGATVRKELTLLSGMFETARREWRWITSNPLKDVRKPPDSEHREVIITPQQIRAMCKALDYKRGRVKSVRQAVAVCFLFALRTGCRAGELTSLEWGSVSEKHFTVDGKTGKRDVPLVRSARRLLDQMEGYDGSKVFGMNARSLDAIFRKYRKQIGMDGVFTFHDSRHTAATRIVKRFGDRIDVLTLCKMFGWRNPAMAMVYYNPTAADITDRMS